MGRVGSAVEALLVSCAITLLAVLVAVLSTARMAAVVPVVEASAPEEPGLKFHRVWVDSRGDSRHLWAVCDEANGVMVYVYTPYGKAGVAAIKDGCAKVTR